MTTDLLAHTQRESGPSASKSPDTSGAPRSAAGEMPVLFQVTDVSQPKGRRPQAPTREAIESASRTSPKTELAAAKEVNVPPAEDPNVLRLSEMARPYTPAALEPSTLWTPSVASLLDDPTLLTETAAAAKPAETRAEKSPATPEAAKAKSTTAKAKVSDKAETDKAKDSAKGEDRRERETSSRRQPARKTDWFSSHGKLIAVGFVLALAATVVVARNKKQAPAPRDDEWSMKHPGDAAEQLAGDGPKIELPALSGRDLPSEAQPTTQPGETSPAAADKLAEKKSAKEKPAEVGQVDLLPPTLPQQSVVETAPARTAPPTSAAPPLVTPPPAAMAEKPAGESVAPASTDPLFQWPQRETQVATRPQTPAVTALPNTTATAPPVNPGEVLNPYTAAKHAAGTPPTTSGPAATVATRSPYVLPNSRQDVSTSPPPTSVYGAPPGGSSNYSEAPNGAYAPTGAYSPAPSYAPAPANTQAPAYPSPPQGSVYAPTPPTTPSPYLPPAGAGGMPVQPGPPPAAAAPSYGAPPTGAPPMGNPNNPPTPGGYRYERTGSGLY